MCWSSRYGSYRYIWMLVGASRSDEIILEASIEWREKKVRGLIPEEHQLLRGCQKKEPVKEYENVQPEIGKHSFLVMIPNRIAKGISRRIHRIYWRPHGGPVSKHTCSLPFPFPFLTILSLLPFSFPMSSLKLVQEIRYWKWSGGTLDGEWDEWTV